MKHAVFTIDESIWQEFDGEVPRVGDEVNFIGDDKKYIVEKVMWFIVSVTDPFEVRRESQARCIIKEINAELEKGEGK